MWKGRPIVASRVGGIQDQISDERDGLLVSPTDAEGFGSALARVLADRALAERLGAAARCRVIDEYLPLRHLAQYAQLLERLEGRSPPG
jgi:trehalose synthase